MSNMFEVNNKYARTTTDVSIVNFEYILQFILLLLLLNSNKYSKTLVSDKTVFNNCEKYIVLPARKIFVELRFPLIQVKSKINPLFVSNLSCLYFFNFIFSPCFLTLFFHFNK